MRRVGSDELVLDESDGATHNFFPLSSAIGQRSPEFFSLFSRERDEARGECCSSCVQRRRKARPESEREGTRIRNSYCWLNGYFLSMPPFPFPLSLNRPALRSPSGAAATQSTPLLQQQQRRRRRRRHPGAGISSAAPPPPRRRRRQSHSPPLLPLLRRPTSTKTTTITIPTRTATSSSPSGTSCATPTPAPSAGGRNTKEPPSPFTPRGSRPRPQTPAPRGRRRPLRVSRERSTARWRPQRRARRA